jgi:hypothetical protein
VSHRPAEWGNPLVASQAGFSSFGLDVKTWEQCNTTSCFHRQVKYSLWLTHTDLVGSAARYLPKNYEYADDLFAIDFMAPGRCDPIDAKQGATGP